MYIFSLIKKLFKKNKEDFNEFNYNPLNIPKSEESEHCNHEFMPVDSTRETLACIKCGFIVQRSSIKKDNYD